MDEAVRARVRFVELYREAGPLPILWVGAGASAAAGYPTLWQVEKILRQRLPDSKKEGFELIDEFIDEYGEATVGPS